MAYDLKEGQFLMVDYSPDMERNEFVFYRVVRDCSTDDILGAFREIYPVPAKIDVPQEPVLIRGGKYVVEVPGSGGSYVPLFTTEVDDMRAVALRGKQWVNWLHESGFLTVDEPFFDVNIDDSLNFYASPNNSRGSVQGGLKSS